MSDINLDEVRAEAAAEAAKVARRDAKDIMVLARKHNKADLGEEAIGKGEPADLDYLQRLGETVKTASRCGLGQTSPHPVLSTLKNFRHVYKQLVRERGPTHQPTFDIHAALGEAQQVTGRPSVHV